MALTAAARLRERVREGERASERFFGLAPLVAFIQDNLRSKSHSAPRHCARQGKTRGGRGRERKVTSLHLFSVELMQEGSGAAGGRTHRQTDTNRMESGCVTNVATRDMSKD